MSTKELDEKAAETREAGAFEITIEEGMNLKTLITFAEAIFPGIPFSELSILPAPEGMIHISNANGSLKAN